MPNTSKKNTRGRPRILNKETIINIAFDEYWINGISEVPLSSIAKIAKVSRPGIYCLLYTSPSPRDKRQSRMPSSA